MPLPIERRCTNAVLQLVLDAGGVIAQAQQPVSTWDQDRVTKMEEDLVIVAKNCELFAEYCLADAYRLYQELGNIQGRGEFKPIADQVNDLEKTMYKFADCLFEAYALEGREYEDYSVSPEEIPEDPYSGWLTMNPETGEFDRPGRIKVR